MGVVVGEEQVHQGYQEDRVGPRDQEVQLLPWGQVGRLDRGVPSYQRVQEVRVSRALVGGGGGGGGRQHETAHDGPQDAGQPGGQGLALLLNAEEERKLVS